MAIPAPEQRMLALRSGNMCAFPDCRMLLTAQGPPESPVIVLGQMAHIVAESPDGPRGASPLTAAERNSYPNLILLCAPHHQFIDAAANVPKYTVERLYAMKEDHERWVERITRGRTTTPPDLPAMVQDTVYSNVLPVSQMPRYIFGVPCGHKEADVKPTGIATGEATPFIVRGGWLWAFQDLRDEVGPFVEFVTPKEAERLETREWCTDTDKLAWFQALLNRSLNKLTGRLGLHLDRDHHRYYFAPEEPGEPREVSYRPLNAAKATRLVVWQPKKKADGEPRTYWLHRAVGLRFIYPGAGQWCLTIRPELRITSDGYESIESKGIGRRVTRKKSRMFNYDLLAEVQFWRDYLSRSGPRIILPFGPNGQSLIISTSMGTGHARWPGIPAEFAKPFKNVEYLDDLFTWAEAEAALNEGDDDADLWDNQDVGAGEVTG